MFDEQESRRCALQTFWSVNFDFKEVNLKTLNVKNCAERKKTKPEQVRRS